MAFWLAARLFSLEQVGIFSFWLACGSLASVLGDFGLSEHLMRTAPGLGGGSDRLIGSALRARLVGGVVVALLTWSGAMALGHAVDLGAAGAFLFGISVGLADFLAAARRARGRFVLEAVESGLASIGGLAAAAVAVLEHASFTWFQLALGLGTFAVVAARVATLAREETSAMPPLPARSLVGDSRWLWLKALVGWTFLDATVLLLAVFSDNVQVALFTGAARLVGLMTQPLIALNWVFTPALAHEAALGRERLERGVRRLNLIGIALAPLGVATCIALGRAGLSGFGAAYRAAEPALLVLALGFAIHATVLNTVPLIVTGAERRTVLAGLAGFGVVAGGVVLLAPAFGALGAAGAVLFGLLVSKLLVVRLYVRAALPLGGWSGGIAVAAVLAWSGGVWVATGWVRDGLLITGGVVGLVASLRLLHRTRIFAGTD